MIIEKREAEKMLMERFGKSFNPNSIKWKNAKNFLLNDEQILTYTINNNCLVAVSLQTGEQWHKDIEGFWIQDFDTDIEELFSASS